MVIKHHYVPRFYLEGFVDSSNSSFLWVADTQRNEVRKESSKNAARISGYYDLHSANIKDKAVIEKSLSVFESRAAPIIRGLQNRSFDLGPEDRYHLANFIGLQLTRVPIFRQQVDNNIENRANDWLMKYVMDSEKFQGELGEGAEAFKNSVLSGRLRIQPQFSEEVQRDDFIIAATIKAGFDFAGVIFGMRWVFLLCNEGFSSFFTSDNPARLMAPDAKPLKIDFKGRNEPLEISFPISSSCTLWMHARNDHPDITSIDLREVESDTVDELNWRILPTIYRYAYCSTEKQARWVLCHIKNIGNAP